MKSLKKLLVAVCITLAAGAAQAQSIWGPGVASAFTTGSILFASGGVVTQDNANLFWDGTNHRLGIGNAVPSVPLDVTGAANISGVLTDANSYVLTGSTANPGAGIRYIGTDGTANSFVYNALTGGGHQFAVNNTIYSNLTATSLALGVPFVASHVGPYSVGGGTATGSQLFLHGSYSGNVAFDVESTLTPVVGVGAYTQYIGGTINKAGSGTHADFASLYVVPPTIGAGAATLTNATTLKITGAPSVGTNQRALWVTGGATELDGGVRFGAATSTLSNYDEGTATVTLTGSTAAPTTPITTTATYIRIGKLVFLTFAFSNVDTTGATGVLQVTGIPFAPASLAHGISELVGFTATAPLAEISPASTTMTFQETSGGANINMTAGAGRYTRVSITYNM